MIVALALAALLLSGCTDSNETLSQALTPGVPYPTTVNQVFQPSDPVALLTVTRSGRAMPQVVITGRIHGWPFPHEDPSGDFGEGLFGYRVEAIATRTMPGGELPESARGTREVYYYGNPQGRSFSQPNSFASGEAVIGETVDMEFQFSTDRSHIDVTMQTHQVATAAFLYNDETVLPPQDEGDKVERLSGSYSPQLGGYELR